ncbi:MAG TPA: PEGA domain-containing protein [Phycisphaerales bacterium]|nr:PEGA domain-containing protein [Phycisphaerales bacterium]
MPLLRLTAIAVLAAGLAGCVERRLEITSEPPGALVYVNDQEVGRTPTEASFLFHGVYDVRVELEGYEPLRTTAEAEAPFYEYAPLDLAAEALPTRIHNVQHWHFVLEPALELAQTKEELEAGLLGRAATMRDELAAIPRPEGAKPAGPEPQDAEAPPADAAAPAGDAEPARTDDPG